jgi:hypothetical protein
MANVLVKAFTGAGAWARRLTALSILLLVLFIYLIGELLCHECYVAQLPLILGVAAIYGGLPIALLALIVAAWRPIQKLTLTIDLILVLINGIVFVNSYWSALHIRGK